MTSNPREITEAPAPGELLGDYRITGTLGRGGMAVVLSATHMATSRECAIKLMLPHGANDEVRRRFNLEYRALSMLDHPNVAKVWEAGLWNDRPYFVMELLRGTDLKAGMKSWSGMPPAQRNARASSVLIQVARALEHIHSRGFVHRDITPGNIMLAPDGVARIMDFGVVKEPGVDLTTVGEVVGTIAYIAPEQILGQRVDERSDLYSLGAVLYVLLTGSRPFHASTLAGYLQKHVNHAPRPPADLVAAVPARLNSACIRLLAKNPDERFASARHLLNFLGDRAVGESVDTETAWAERTVGRAAEMARLHEALALLQGGKGTVLLVEGASGMGKTRLLDDLQQLAGERGIPVARGKCLADVGVPFAAYREVFKGVVNSTELEPPRVLSRALGSARERHKTRHPERYAVFPAFLDLVRRGGPRVLMLDAVHLADSGTVDFTDYLIRNSLGLSDDPLLFVLARRFMSGDSDSWKTVLSGETTGVPVERVHLRPLTRAAVEDLVLDLIPGDESAIALARRLHAEADGNPQFMVAMLRGLIEDRFIGFGPDGRGRLLERHGVLAGGELPVPRSIREAQRERLHALSAPGRELASVLAVSRRELRLPILEGVLHMDESRILGLMGELEEAGIARWRRDDDDLFDLVEPGLREVILEELGPERLRSLHRQMGLMLETHWRGRLSPVLDLLGHHFEHGGIPTKAYVYLLRAGERLLEQALVHEALEMFERALKLEPRVRQHLVLDQADRSLATLLLHRSQAKAHLGQWEQADKDAIQAHDLAQELNDSKLLARTSFELGTMCRRRNDLEAAENYFRKAKWLAEEAGDSRLRAQAMNRIASRRWEQGDLEGAKYYWLEVLGSDDPHARAAGYTGLGVMDICRGRSAEARKNLEEGCRIYEGLGALHEWVIERSNLVELYHLVGNVKRGIERAEQTVARAREIRDRRGLGLALRSLALVLVDIGRLDDAEANAQEALSLSSRQHNREDELGASFNLARVSFHRGEPGQANLWLERAVPMLERYDTEGIAPIIHSWKALVAAHVGDGGLLREHVAAAMAFQEKPWPFLQCRVELNSACAHAVIDDHEPASRLAGSALDRAARAGYRLYTMKAHIILSNVASKPENASHHARVAEAMARSISANLSSTEARSFMDVHFPSGMGF